MIALLGATGYTGKLVAAELTKRRLPHRLGGRSPEKLAALPSDAERFVVDAGEPTRLDAFLDGATALITTVGPFARTHASWTDPDTVVDDHLVSLADKIWKAKRVPDLEDLVTAHLAATCGTERWQAFAQLDDILEALAADADSRLAYQAHHRVSP